MLGICGVGYRAVISEERKNFRCQGVRCPKHGRVNIPDLLTNDNSLFQHVDVLVEANQLSRHSQSNLVSKLKTLLRTMKTLEVCLFDLFNLAQVAVAVRP